MLESDKEVLMARQTRTRLFSLLVLLGLLAVVLPSIADARHFPGEGA
jgi:hypothetical protein